jgi:MoaA/NifB/PqqE/SkfB family radical SAM enzyme
MMYLAPDGNVRACCRSFAPIGNVVDRPLGEIWNGAVRRRMVDALAVGEFPQGCEPCGVEREVEGPERAYTARFDRFGPSLAADADPHGSWPRRIEFNLSNACNLMCIQCDGFLSSSIRAHREHLPALPKVYGDAFFAELEPFVPHLVEAQFAGGEPFLGRENYRVWELVERLNPELSCTVVTNATQWSPRIERVGTTLRMGYTFSLDAVTKETYELIRVGADHDAVVANIPRYLAMAEAQDTTVEVNFCLMQQNHHEFADLLLWAEERGLGVNVCVVRYPEHCSLASLGSDDLRRVVDSLASAEDRVLPYLDRNRTTWVEELERLRRWVDSPPDTLEQLWWSEAWSGPEPEAPPVVVTILPASSSIELGVLGVVDADVDASVRNLAAWATDGRTHQLVADYDPDREPDHLVTSVSDSMAELLGSAPDRLVGRPLQDLQVEIEGRYGPVARSEVVRLDGASREFALQLRDADVRVAMLARANERGRLDGVTVVVAVRTTDGPG